jgi:ribonuclease Z
MQRKLNLKTTLIAAVALAGVAAGHFGEDLIELGSRVMAIPSAHAAGGVVADPKGVTPDRYVYYPGTEALSEGEIRVIACGTGMPAARRGQAATCFLVETGNGDKFIFDIGSGSAANLAALMIPYQYLDKVFLTQAV